MNEQVLAVLVGKKCEGIIAAPEHGLLTIFFEGHSLTLKISNGGLIWEIEEASIH